MTTIMSLSDFNISNFIFVFLLLITQFAFVIRVLIRPHRQPAARISWIVIITLIPAIGILIYILFGETTIGKQQALRAKEVLSKLPALSFSGNNELVLNPPIPAAYRRLFKTVGSVCGFQTLGGNSTQLFSCSDKTINSMVKDINQAKENVHIIFYIWLTDNNGQKMINAFKKAAQRGISCRIMVDGLGSRGLIQSKYWAEMEAAGVQMAVSLPIGNILLKPFKGRIDLRNHRKIVVIDNKIAYCGSQNCADAEFLVKKKYAPWVDVVMRFNGPVVLQQQRLFIADWLTNVNENLDSLINQKIDTQTPGFPALAFGTGPTMRYSAMPEIFETMMFSAEREIVISTPYYVPDEPLQSALCTAAMRGVDTTIIFPARNDSFIVAAASRSYYMELLNAGVKIYEYVGGLLHAKTFTIDGHVSLIGSANMDRRSFDLNYENNILLCNEETTADFRDLQFKYISKSNRITIDEVKKWSIYYRLWNNTISMMGPLL